MSKAEAKVSEPLVCCITPTRDRPEMAERSVRSMRHQLGVKHCGYILDSGDDYWYSPPKESIGCYGPEKHQRFRMGGVLYSTGRLRNKILSQEWPPLQYCEFIAHFDDDDVSLPDRLSIQLAHIQATGKLVTGFFDMLFYDQTQDRVMYFCHEDPRYALGTSLFYRREAWEQHKFPDETPEDNKWRAAVGLENCLSRSSLREDGSPIMIQVIHGANASAQIVTGSPRWKTPTAAQDRAVREILAKA